MSAESTGSFEETWERADVPIRRVGQLVLVWTLDEPRRLGEARVIEKTCSVGRGLGLDDDAAPRIFPSRVRPGGLLPTSPLASARVSRQQLVISPLSDERLEVKNLAHAPMRINGTPMAQAIEGEELASVKASHEKYGVTREMYAWVGDALVAAVTDALGERLSAERRHALVSGWGAMTAIIFNEA